MMIREIINFVYNYSFTLDYGKEAQMISLLLLVTMVLKELFFMIKDYLYGNYVPPIILTFGILRKSEELILVIHMSIISILVLFGTYFVMVLWPIYFIMIILMFIKMIMKLLSLFKKKEKGKKGKKAKKEDNVDSHILMKQSEYNEKKKD